MEAAIATPQTTTTTQPIPNQDPTKQQPKKEQAGQPTATQTPATESAAINQGQSAVKKWKLNIAGKDEELDEPEVLRRAQIYTAGQKSFQEASQMKKQAESFIELLKNNFTDLLDDPRLGLDESQKRQMLENYYKRKYIDPETMTPEQKRIREQETELQRYRQSEKDREQQKQDDNRKLVQQHYQEHYQKEIITGLQSANIPQTEYTVNRMVDLMTKNLEMGLQIPSSHLAQLVREDYIKEQKALFLKSDGEELLKLFDEEIINRIRKADLARLKSGIPQVPKAPIDTPKANQAPAPKQWKSIDDWKAEVERRVKELDKK